MIRTTLIVSMFIAAGCGDWVSPPEDVQFSNYFTGETCSPDPLTYMAKSAQEHESNGNVSPTGIPGDNMDDTRSGKVDCLYDGNSGQGDDWKYPECNAEDFPQPGCDENGCCEEPCGEPEEDEPAEEEEEEEPVQDPPEEEPAQDPPAEDPV